MKKLKTVAASRPYLWAELLILGGMVPVGAMVFKLANQMFLILWSAAIYCLLMHLWQHKPDLYRLWNGRAVTWKNVQPILWRWLGFSALLALFTWYLFPIQFLSLPRHAPEILWKIFLLYPVLSALPQEYIFCSYFFQRYKPLFGAGTAVIIASAVVFAVAHILYINWVAPLIGLGGGLLFALTYAKHRSLALVTLEHGLYGNTLFFIGLGWFFWGGSVN